MNRLLASFLGCLLFLSATPYAAEAADVGRAERDLIAVVNLSIHAEKYKWLYRYEEKRAANKIRRRLSDDYRRVRVFEKQEATRANLLAAIAESENDPAVKAIDVIIYVHGEPGYVGFVDGYRASSALAQDIRDLELADGGAPRKLRALYSDACYGESHVADWLHAGFRAALGSEGVDSNWSIDLGKFMNSWAGGKPFARGLRRANSGWRSDVADWAIKGNSHKRMDGDAELTIATPVL